MGIVTVAIATTARAVKEVSRTSRPNCSRIGIRIARLVPASSKRSICRSWNLQCPLKRAGSRACTMSLLLDRRVSQTDRGTEMCLPCHPAKVMP